MLPPTLIIEGMAQIGGIMVAEHVGFDRQTVLAKVNKAKFHAPARIGDQLRYEVRLDRIQENGATVTSVSRCDGEVQAEIDLMFAFLEEGRFASGTSLFEPGDLEAMLRMMNFFEVAVDADGNRLPKYENL